MAYNLRTTEQGLQAPVDYLLATKAYVDGIVNGCGPKGWKIDIVPDTIYGLSIAEACNIHDWMYEFGISLDDKRIADDIFLINLNKIIDDRGGFFFIIWLRKQRAQKYYCLVDKFGERPFLNKESQKLMKQ